ncbi:hypothetical protein BU25DRAFT_177347 [Macroventuria anomochaeta]|uniref:Uncharacterized protein n=1 Tax=Macroventuria anomochaeta TaxID=301207 RepID=A0ACB6RQD2_9PLEO|nr:uncharacterized protein BU25DRAFT_177347 [Macroventuria anomochaeta]KAF2623605.1 hypothetical protein BU25DRAFT_177347 [Macroventuria anomochaeta]
MAEIFGAVVGGVALSTQLTQCGKKIRKAIKKIKSSRRDISELADDTVIFAGLCEGFLRACADGREAHIGRSSSIGSLNIWIKKTLAGLHELLRKVEALKHDPRYRSWQDTLIAYLEWFFSTSSVKHLRANMAVARESINGFSNLMCIQKLNEELRMLRIALTRPMSRAEIERNLRLEIEEKIDLVKQAIKIKNSVHRTRTRQLRAATRNITQNQPKGHSIDFVSAPTELLRFTTSLDTFAEEVLSSRQSSRRTNSSRASDYISTISEPSTSTPQRPSMPATTSGINIETSSSISTVSTNSNQTPILDPSSISSAPAIYDDTPEPRSSHKSANKPIYSSGGTVERFDMRAREYINDPDGTILSPPKVKPHYASTSIRKETQIGRHTITLDATEFTMNTHSLRVDNYEVGLKFFQTLKEHQDKLDRLDQVLGKGDEYWYGIPDWVITPTGVTMQATALGIRDV